MYSFILGFQRLVWCPKWTPASSNSFMVMVANQPPYWIASRLEAAITVPVPPLPQRRAREEFGSGQSCLAGRPEPPRSAKSGGGGPPAKVLALAELEALSRALLAVLLTLFTTRVAGQ